MDVMGGRLTVGQPNHSVRLPNTKSDLSVKFMDQWLCGCGFLLQYTT